MCGPTGVGVLYGKYELLEKLPPFIAGGDTVREVTYDKCEFLAPPEKYEGGLQNYAGQIGAGVAADYLMKIGLDEIRKHEYELNKYISKELDGIKGLKIIGPPDVKDRGGIISFTVKGINPHDIAMIFDEVGNIMLRSGKHCAHPWLSAHGIEGTVRASLYLYNTMAEGKIFIEKLQEIIQSFS
jgi:cysteine desulfurase/selenocysteine lyase